jgi:hypothetical protein
MAIHDDEGLTQAARLGTTQSSRSPRARAALSILNRARTLGIKIASDGSDLLMLVPVRVPGETRRRFERELAEYRAEIIEVILRKTAARTGELVLDAVEDDVGSSARPRKNCSRPTASGSRATHRETIPRPAPNARTTARSASSNASASRLMARAPSGSATIAAGPVRERVVPRARATARAATSPRPTTIPASKKSAIRKATFRGFASVTASATAGSGAPAAPT